MICISFDQNCRSNIFWSSEKHTREASGSFRRWKLVTRKQYRSFYMLDRLISPIMANNQRPASTRLR